MPPMPNSSPLLSALVDAARKTGGRASSMLGNPYEALGPLYGLAMTRSLPTYDPETMSMVYTGGPDLEPTTVGHNIVLPQGASKDIQRHERRHVAQQEALGPASPLVTLLSGLASYQNRPLERDAMRHEWRQKTFPGAGTLAAPVEAYLRAVLGE